MVAACSLWKPIFSSFFDDLLDVWLLSVLVVRTRLWKPVFSSFSITRWMCDYWAFSGAINPLKTCFLVLSWSPAGSVTTECFSGTNTPLKTYFLVPSWSPAGSVTTECLVVRSKIVQLRSDRVFGAMLCSLCYPFLAPCIFLRQYLNQISSALKILFFSHEGIENNW